jgi:uncharacterized protein YuzB (UPF0349 family)
MRGIVEFCQSNLSAGTDRVKEELEKEKDLDVIEYGCLGHCGECYEYPFALVNGNVVMGTSTKDLLEKVKKAIEEDE